MSVRPASSCRDACDVRVIRLWRVPKSPPAYTTGVVMSVVISAAERARL